MNHRAQHLISLSRHADALKELDQSFDSEDPHDWWLRGLALLGLDRLDDSLRAIESGLKIDPGSALLLDLLARCQSSRGDLVAAEQAALAGLRIDAEDADLLAVYALIVAKAGQLDKAKKLIAQALRIEPENAGALRLDAAIALTRGDQREAMLRSHELLKIDPEDHFAHTLRGEMLHNRGDVHGAAEHLRTAVINDPSDPIAAEIARDNLQWRHPLMWPLLPAHKFGAAKVWVAGVVLILIARMTRNDTLTLTVAGLWVLYCVYSWVVPPIVRRLVR